MKKLQARKLLYPIKTLFKQSIEPLVKSGKLGALLAQFPPSFKNDKYGHRILMAIVRVFRSYRLAVELRHRSWSDDMNFPQLLQDNNVSWVHIDEPKFQSSVASGLPQTSDIGYFRFHGRNKEMWWQGDNETRYKYLYSQDEINELAEKVKAVANRIKYTFALFNNHWQGYAPRNAVGMMKALQLPLRELPIQIPLDDDREKPYNPRPY
jgi:uncharacterized protein YecE (DUF72 family)